MLKLTDLPPQVQLDWNDPVSWQHFSTTVLTSGHSLIIEVLFYYDGQEHYYYRWHDPGAQRYSECAFTSTKEVQADCQRYQAQQYPNERSIAVII